MEKAKTQPSADLIGLHFPRQRKTAKRLITPRVQAMIYVGESSFGVELSAPIEGLKLLNELSLPIIGYLFNEIARRTVDRLARQSRPGRVRASTTPLDRIFDVSTYDMAMRTADLIGPSIWQWLTEEDRKGMSNADRIVRDLGKPRGMTAKAVLAEILQSNWEQVNGSWPGALPNDEPEAFFRKLNKRNGLNLGYSLLPLPPAQKMVKSILGKKKTYTYQLLNGNWVLPEHMLPPLNHLPS